MKFSGSVLIFGIDSLQCLSVASFIGLDASEDAKHFIEGLVYWPAARVTKALSPLSIIDVAIRAAWGRDRQARRLGPGSHHSSRLQIRQEPASDSVLLVHHSKRFDSKTAVTYARLYIKVFDSPPQNQTFITSQENFLPLFLPSPTPPHPHRFQKNTLKFKRQASLRSV